MPIFATSREIQKSHRWPKFYSNELQNNTSYEQIGPTVWAVEGGAIDFSSSYIAILSVERPKMFSSTTNLILNPIRNVHFSHYCPRPTLLLLSTFLLSCSIGQRQTLSLCQHQASSPWPTSNHFPFDNVNPCPTCHRLTPQHVGAHKTLFQTYQR